ncbi:Golgi transport complex subunit 3 [Coemansia sp. Benny D115]|nr:Golgi transport complex subunit 3 [Coemansia sp. Benny D115]
MAISTPNPQADDWERKYGVSEDELFRSSIRALQEACSGSWQLQTGDDDAGLGCFGEIVRQPGVLSNEVSAAEVALSKVNPQLTYLRGSPKLSARRNASLRNLTALGASHQSSEGREDGLAEAVSTPAQFLEWFARVERQVCEGQDRSAHAYAERLRRRVVQCQDMQQGVAEAVQMLDRLEAGCSAVARLTEGVQAAAAQVQRRREAVEQLGADIRSQLAVYESLGPITQLLHAPGDQVCLDPEFLPAIEQIEQAIGFIEAHMEARDSELYLMRFSQSRMRALTLIKIYALREFQAAGAGASAGTQAALYVRFRMAAARLAPLLLALQQRAAHEGNATEQAVLDSVLDAYFSVRLASLRVYMRTQMQGIAAEHGNSIAYALRDWCAFAMNVCADEYRIYADFFGVPQRPLRLREHLDSAMVMFHDHIRPLIIHEADVAVLAEISMTLSTFCRPLDEDDVGGTGPGRDGVYDAAATDDVDGLGAFYAVVGEILQDAQHRLAYKAQSYIRSHILQYKASADDTAATIKWMLLCSSLQVTDPAQIAAIVSQSSQQRNADAEEVSKRRASSDSAQPPPFADRASSEDVHTLEWEYPPVANSRWLISQIDRRVDREVQLGLTEEALGACKQNLLSHAARTIQGRNAAAAVVSDAEKQIHVFVTYSLMRLEDAVV